MEAIIDFIFSNFIIVLIIIGGLAKLLGGDNKEQQKKQTNQPPRPTEARKQTTPIPGRPRAQQPKASRSTNPMGQPRSVGQSISIEEEQQKQFEQLAGKMNAESVHRLENLSDEITSGNEITDSAISLNKKRSHHPPKHNKHRKQVKHQMKKRLSENGLTESIIMAEVLGPPRARKPYKSIIAQRHN